MMADWASSTLHQAPALPAIACGYCGLHTFPPLSAYLASDAQEKRFVTEAAQPRGKRVGLLVTCLVDLIRPSIGFASVKLLEDAGCTVEVPRQTCCVQPAFNSGDRNSARAIAESVIAAFEPYDYVVVPSGSCGGMVKTHYPELFPGDPAWLPRVEKFCAKTFELVSFLVDVLKVESVKARFPGTVTYHDACSGLRELGIKAQ